MFVTVLLSAIVMSLFATSSLAASAAAPSTPSIEIRDSVADPLSPDRLEGVVGYVRKACKLVAGNKTRFQTRKSLLRFIGNIPQLLDATAKTSSLLRDVLELAILDEFQSASMAERSGMLLELLEQHENLEPNEAGTYFAVNTLNLALAKIGETISGAKRLRAGYKHKNRHAKFQLENKNDLALFFLMDVGALKGFGDLTWWQKRRVVCAFEYFFMCLFIDEPNDVCCFAGNLFATHMEASVYLHDMQNAFANGDEGEARKQLNLFQAAYAQICKTQHEHTLSDEAFFDPSAWLSEGNVVSVKITTTKNGTTTTTTSTTRVFIPPRSSVAGVQVRVGETNVHISLRPAVEEARFVGGKFTRLVGDACAEFLVELDTVATARFAANEALLESAGFDEQVSHVDADNDVEIVEATGAISFQKKWGTVLVCHAFNGDPMGAARPLAVDYRANGAKLCIAYGKMCPGVGLVLARRLVTTFIVLGTFLYNTSNMSLRVKITKDPLATQIDDAQRAARAESERGVLEAVGQERGVGNSSASRTFYNHIGLVAPFEVSDSPPQSQLVRLLHGMRGVQVHVAFFKLVNNRLVPQYMTWYANAKAAPGYTREIFPGGRADTPISTESVIGMERYLWPLKNVWQPFGVSRTRPGITFWPPAGVLGWFRLVPPNSDHFVWAYALLDAPAAAEQ